MPVKIKKKRSPVKPALIIVAAIVVIAAIGGYIWHREAHKAATVTSTSRNEFDKPVPNPNVPGGNTTNTPGSSISTNKGSGSSTPPTVSNSVQPSAPQGDFVSSHTITLSENELSACNTTAGVQCKITFTMGSTTVSLPGKTTDSNGSASWNWTPQSIGLTPGSWTVTAVATNGSKSASTVDVNRLTVNQ